MKKGKLIVIEGIDGCGKTTLIKKLKKHFSLQKFIFTKEPGGTSLGLKLREIINKGKKEITEKAEFLLFAADRNQHFQHLIIPALKKGKIIISDRMADSSLAYQGYGRGVDIKMIKKINKWVTSNTTPDITIYLHITPEVAFQRIRKRNLKLTNFEKERKKFWSQVVNGYSEIFKRRKNLLKVDASQSLEKVSNIVITYLEKKLKLK